MDSKKSDGVKAVSVTKPAEGESRVRAQVGGNLELDSDILYEVQLEDGRKLFVLSVEQKASASDGKVRTVITIDASRTTPIATFQTKVE
jgi:hypothetical protein